MNPLDRLSEYLRTVEKRLRLLTWTRGAAIAAGAALVSTIVLVLIANSFAFSSGSLLASRTVLFLALALAIGAGLLIPLLRLNARRAAREAAANPQASPTATPDGGGVPASTNPAWNDAFRRMQQRGK